MPVLKRPQKRPASRSGRSNWPVRPSKRPVAGPKATAQPILDASSRPSIDRLAIIKQEPEVPKSFVSVAVQTRAHVATIIAAQPGSRMAKDRAQLLNSRMAGIDQLCMVVASTRDHMSCCCNFMGRCTRTYKHAAKTSARRTANSTAVRTR